MHERKGDWMQTYTGRQFWPLDPRASEVHIEDIAHALALQCRFAGHCREFYSVAEHSYRVAQYLIGQGHPVGTCLIGLLHDASEAYLVDVPRPVKPHLKEYKEIEARVEAAIFERFDLRWADDREHGIVKHADNVLLATEARDLMAPPPAPWAEMPEPLSGVIQPMGWMDAQSRFLSCFRWLSGAY